MTGHGLVDKVPALGKMLALLCVAALLHPGPANGVRRKRVARSEVKPQPTNAVRPPAATRAKADRQSRSMAARPRIMPERGSCGVVDEHIHLRRGDTLESLLASRGVSSSEAYPWLVAAGNVYDLRALHPRRGVTLTFDRATRGLEGIRYEIDDRTLLVLAATSTGVSARREELPYFIEVKGVAGRIERGLREDAVQAGVPPRVVADLADVFGWDVDVESGLRPGDEFRVLYENVWQTGLGHAEAGNVIGASLVTHGETVTAVYFEDADGFGTFYRPSGAALSRTFLRYPVEFSEITSEFSLLRQHPILHVGRPHRGVDLAAPQGTPVRAVASGEVTAAGWAGGLGQSVRIEHANGLTSIYGHLSRFAPRVAEGLTVGRGQVIGYVGSTGLATGPHLHYALEREGEYVDPLGVTVEAEATIPAALRRAFERVKTEVTQQLARLPESSHPQTVSFSPPAYEED